MLGLVCEGIWAREVAVRSCCVWLSARRQTLEWVHAGLLCVAVGVQAWLLWLGACRAGVWLGARGDAPCNADRQ